MHETSLSDFNNMDNKKKNAANQVQYFLLKKMPVCVCVRFTRVNLNEANGDCLIDVDISKIEWNRVELKMY